DCVQNARSALDHLVWQLVYKYTGEDSSSCEFPIFHDRDDYLKGKLQPARGQRAPRRSNPGTRKVRGVHPGAKTIIKSLQPYNRTDGPPDLDPLYLLHGLNNRDKHRVLNLAVLAVGQIGLHVGELVNVRHRVIEQATGALEDGAVFARLLLE